MGAGSADPSPHKTAASVGSERQFVTSVERQFVTSVGSPRKAPKVAGAEQASADPGVRSPDSVCVCVCVCVLCVCVCVCVPRP